MVFDYSDVLLDIVVGGAARALQPGELAQRRCFQLGLDETTFRCNLPTCDFSLIELINLILCLNGPEMEVEEFGGGRL